MEAYLNSLETKCMLRVFTYLIVIIVKVYGAGKNVLANAYSLGGISNLVN